MPIIEALLQRAPPVDPEGRHVRDVTSRLGTGSIHVLAARTRRMVGTGVQVLMQLESARAEDSGGAARELVIGSHAVMHEKQKLTTGRRAGG